MEDYDAEVHVDPPEEPQEQADGRHIKSKGNAHRRNPHSGRDIRRDEHENVPGTRRRAGPSISTPPVRHNMERALKALTKQPGGSFDSFNTLPSGGDSSDFVAKLVLHAHYQVYSNFFVGEARATSILPYTKYALHHEAAYWGAAWFSCTSRRWLEGRSMRHTPQEMFFYSKCLESLRHALSDPVTATHESTISAILHLSFPPYLPYIDRSVPTPRQSNFKTWNLLHLATGLNVAEEHMIGLSAVVKMLGGVHNIRSAQIRRSVCFQGIHFSGRHLKAPLFPFASLYPVEELVQGSQLIHVWPALEPMQQPTGLGRGIGFQYISFPETPRHTPQPAVVWAYLADMTTILEDYASGGSRLNQSSLILDQMQYTQHSLLSLFPAADLKPEPTKEEEDDDEESNTGHVSRHRLQYQLYEVTRLACICYANFVTYPTDYSTFPRHRLIKILLKELENLHAANMMPQYDMHEVRLVFWATVMGAIMAVGLEPERTAFVALVGRAAVDAKATSWIEAKQIMESFLWHSPTNDADALKLWIEVQQLGRGRTMSERLSSNNDNNRGSGSQA